MMVNAVKHGGKWSLVNVGRSVGALYGEKYDLIPYTEPIACELLVLSFKRVTRIFRTEAVKKFLKLDLSALIEKE